MIPKNAIVRNIMIVIAIVIAAAFLFGSVRTVFAPTPPLASQVILTSQDEVAIYQAVILAIAPPDPEVGPRYILRTTDDRSGQYPQAGALANPVTLSPTTQAGLSAVLGNVIWIDDFKLAARDAQTGRLLDGGVFVTLGNITLGPEHQSRVSASVFRNSLNAAGYSYILDWVNGIWKITNAQMNWIS
jgi:hypothetical protein